MPLVGIAAAFLFLEKDSTMKSAEKSLESLHRCATMSAMLTSTTTLPPDVSFAASRGLKLAPVQGLSRFASVARTRLGYPTADLVQLQILSAEFPMCNWAMLTDSVTVLEYNPALGRHSLCELCGGDWDGWRDTLQFRSGATRFLLFRYNGQRLRVLGPRAAGLRVHCGDMLLVPPSRFLSSALRWSNPSAAIAAIPEWLLEADEDYSGGNPPSTVPATPPFAGEPDEPRYIYDHYSL